MYVPVWRAAAELGCSSLLVNGKLRRLCQHPNKMSTILKCILTKQSWLKLELQCEPAPSTEGANLNQSPWPNGDLFSG